MASPANGLQRFTIFFQGRSGSTYLVEALDSHPRIRCEMERLVGLRKAGADGQLKWIEQFFAGEEEPRRRQPSGSRRNWTTCSTRTPSPNCCAASTRR